MGTSLLFNRHREKTVFLRTRYLLDIYMREGHGYYHHRKYEDAIGSYRTVLEFDLSNIEALVGLSKCHVQLGRMKQALALVERALTVDNTNPVAVLQKADIFYGLENYEMALLFYHRGHKMAASVGDFQDGVNRCVQNITHLDKGKAMKLTAVGDLTIYVHKKMRKMGRTKRQKPLPTRTPLSQPSNGRHKQKTKVNPLLKLNKRQSVKVALQDTTNRRASNKVALQDTTNRRASNKETNGRRGHGSTFSDADDTETKHVLEELYHDKLYLQNFLKEMDEDESRLDLEVSDIAEIGLQFLQDAVNFWSYRRLPPDPTPSPPLSLKHSRQGSSKQAKLSASPLTRQNTLLWEREISDLIRVLDDENSHGDENQPDVVNTPHQEIVGYRPYKKEKKGVRILHFAFTSHRRSSAVSEDGDDANGKTGSEKEKHLEDDVAEDEEVDQDGGQEDQIMKYLKKTLVDLEECFEKEDYGLCKRMASSCLHTVYNYSNDDIVDKLDLVAKVHSFLGNALMELEEFGEALEHHQKDLDIGEECNIDEPVSRALGNLGRVYVHTKQYYRALGAFARKAKLVDRPVEVAWLFHELGDCFLSLGQYGYAADCGRRSLKNAELAGHGMYQLQASVLIGVSQVKLKDYTVSYSTFQHALDLATVEGDKESESMIIRALDEVNHRISGRQHPAFVEDMRHSTPRNITPRSTVNTSPAHNDTSPLHTVTEGNESL